MSARDDLEKALDDQMWGRASDLDRILPVIVDFVADWMTAWYEHPDAAHFSMPSDWRAEMGGEATQDGGAA